MTSRAQLVREIRVDPDPDGPRLVAADWFTEHGDNLGEYIVGEVQLAKVTFDDERWWPLRKRVTELEHEHAEGWSEPLRELGAEFPPGSAWIHRTRGFVEHLALRREATKNFDRICDLEPVLYLDVNVPEPALREMPELALLRGLHVTGGHAYLLSSPHLANLPSLGCSTPLTFEDARALATGPMRPKRLDTWFDAAVARILVEGNVFENVESISYYGIDEERFRILAGAPLAKLARLDLIAPSISADAIRALGARIDQLEVLKYHAPIDRTRAAAFIDHMPSARLRHVDVTTSETDLDGILALLESEAFRNVETLHVSKTNPAIDAAIKRLPKLTTVER